MRKTRKKKSPPLSRRDFIKAVWPETSTAHIPDELLGVEPGKPVQMAGRLCGKARPPRTAAMMGVTGRNYRVVICDDLRRELPPGRIKAVSAYSKNLTPAQRRDIIERHIVVIAFWRRVLESMGVGRKAK